MKFGLEKEYFVQNSDGEFIVCPRGIPSDSCGLLAEARGKPFDNFTDAVFSLMAVEHQLKKQAHSELVVLVEVPIAKISRDLRLEASRTYAKGLTKYKNLYGYERHRNAQTEMTAGVHVSFTDPQEVNHKGEKITTVNRLWDYAQIIRKLDNRFAEEIVAAKRRPGFYEIKPDRRLEYRSLPNNVDLFKLITVMEEITSER